jgi:hypothetical protein
MGQYRWSVSMPRWRTGAALIVLQSAMTAFYLQDTPSNSAARYARVAARIPARELGQAGIEVADRRPQTGSQFRNMAGRPAKNDAIAAADVRSDCGTKPATPS